MSDIGRRLGHDDMPPRAAQEIGQAIDTFLDELQERLTTRGQP